MEKHRFDTVAIHAGEEDFRLMGGVNPPIFYSSSYIYADETDELKYPRLSNTPNLKILNDKIALLEGGEAALVSASGMASISTTLMAVVEPGGHVLAQTGLYGTAQYFLKQDFPAMGYSASFMDMTRPETWEKELRPNTKAIYVECLTNPLLEVADFEAIVAFAKTKGLVTIIDNTFLTPLNFRPINVGFDLVLHSCTKYFNGHSDIVAGCVVGSKKLIDKIAPKHCHFGGVLDPNAAYLLNRGLKTLALRMRQHNENALTLAKHLSTHPEIERVVYPGLETHPGYSQAKKYFRGFGGMMAFDIKGDTARTERFLKKLTIPLVAVSLGGVESLMTRPSLTSHKGVSRDDRLKMGLKDHTIRFSVGIEDVRDLIADIDQALS